MFQIHVGRAKQSRGTPFGCGSIVLWFSPGPYEYHLYIQSVVFISFSAANTAGDTVILTLSGCLKRTCVLTILHFLPQSTAWGVGSIRRPFLETLKRTDKDCRSTWLCCGGRYAAKNIQPKKVVNYFYNRIAFWLDWIEIEIISVLYASHHR